MNIEEYIKSKLNELNRLVRDADVLKMGLKSYMHRFVIDHAKQLGYSVGSKVIYESEEYEVVCINSEVRIIPPSIYDTPTTFYSVLLLKTINREPDNSILGKRIRKDKHITAYKYHGARNIKVKKYYQKNTKSIDIQIY